MDGALPQVEWPFEAACDTASVMALEPVALGDLCKVAEEYLRRTGERLTVTSARRTLRKTAAIMAGFSAEQLEMMYCRNGYPDYIRAMVAKLSEKGSLLTEDEVYEILRNRKEGYISSHLSGGAVDFWTEGLGDRELLMELLRCNNFTAFDETAAGVRCIHASHSMVPRLMIME